MKIYFDNCNFSSQSGPNSFATRLAKELTIQGHSLADADDYDIALCFIEPQKLRKDKPYVLRLDGIWTKPQEYSWRNSGIKKAYAEAVGVIFQSEFNKNQITNWWGDPKTFAIIQNGICLEKQTETLPGFQQLRDQYDKIFVCSANWHPQKRLKENIRFFKKMKERYSKSCLVVLGANPDHVVADPHIFYTGSLTHQECLKLYAVADWMIHLAYLDHNPNVVVECLSQGTPVICSEDGGTRELVGANGVIINEKEKYDFSLFDYDSPPDLPDNFGITELPDIDVDPSHLDIKNVAMSYIKFLEKCL